MACPILPALVEKSIAKQKRKCKTKAEPPAKMVQMKAVYTSVIGIDVHHSILVCCHVQSTAEGQSVAYEEFGTGRAEIARFGQWCRDRNPELIIMESTGVLWYLPYDELENRFFKKHQLVVVNARDHKGRAGHKTDSQDAHHLAQLGMLNDFRRSFILPRELRDIRSVSRSLFKHIERMAQLKNIYQKDLNSTGSRASAVFSDVYGVAAQAIIHALITGTPEELETTVRLNRTRLKASAEEILDALRPIQSSPMQYTLRTDLKELKQMEQLVEDQENYLESLLKPYWHWVELLMSIPGIHKRGAMMLFAELGNDLSDFASSKNLASWAGLCPGVNQSAGKTVYSRKRKTGRGNKYVRKLLVEAAHGISKMKSGSPMERFQVKKEQRGHRKAIVATAHMLIRFIYAIFRDDKPYEDQHSAEVRLEQHRIKKFKRDRKALAEANIELVDPDTAVSKTTGVHYHLTN